MQGINYKHTSESLQKAFKYLFPNEVPELKRLARLLPDNPVIVNIGAGAGTSGLAFLESRDDITVYTIDIRRENSPFGSLESEELVIRNAGYAHAIDQGLPAKPRLFQYQGDSKAIGLAWKQGIDTVPYPVYHNHLTVDMVFVDGDHSYEGCSGDINNWIPNIKSGGILSVHDYKKSVLYTTHDPDEEDDKPHPKDYPGVDRAVEEILIPNFEIVGHVDSLISFRI